MGQGENAVDGLAATANQIYLRFLFISLRKPQMPDSEEDHSLPCRPIVYFLVIHAASYRLMRYEVGTCPFYQPTSLSPLQQLTSASLRRKQQPSWPRCLGASSQARAWRGAGIGGWQRHAEQRTHGGRDGSRSWQPGWRQLCSP